MNQELSVWLLFLIGSALGSKAKAKSSTLSVQSTVRGFEGCAIINFDGKKRNIKVLRDGNFVEYKAIEGDLTVSDALDAVDILNCKFDPPIEGYEILGG